MRLRHQDWKKLFAAVAELHSDINPSTLGARAIRATNMIVSGEITAFDFFTDSGVHTRETWYDPPDAITQEAFEILEEYVAGHPFVPYVFGEKCRDALQTNDCVSPSRFRETAIYNEYYSLFPVHHQLMVPIWVQSDLLVTCIVNRKDRAFTGEEQWMFDLIAPHLTNVIKNGRKVQKLFDAEAKLDSAMEGKSSGVVSIDANGRIEYMSRHAAFLMEKYFGSSSEKLATMPYAFEKCFSATRTKRGLLFGSAIVRFDEENSSLHVSTMPGGRENELILILEERTKPSPANLVKLGLSKRQTEVLFWISQGKTDKDISQLLGISPRTVHKHIENIYLNLGVETRTAAMLRAVETF